MPVRTGSCDPAPIHQQRQQRQQQCRRATFFKRCCVASFLTTRITGLRVLVSVAFIVTLLHNGRGLDGLRRVTRTDAGRRAPCFRRPSRRGWIGTQRPCQSAPLRKHARRWSGPDIVEVIVVEFDKLR
ncbi:MAG: hypothetical protein D6725_09390 [Planctomycetota bacterium]|nr:MAG: hypothetical protein D6725_09390 [Planctomycetota bacterium]